MPSTRASSPEAWRPGTPSATTRTTCTSRAATGPVSPTRGSGRSCGRRARRGMTAHRAALDGASSWARAHPRAVLLGPVGLFLGAFFLGPLVSVLRVSLAANPGGTGYGDGVPFYVPGTWTLSNYARFFGDAYFLHVTAFTLKLGLLTAAVTTAVSYSLAWQIHRARPAVKLVLLLVVVLPKFTNVLVLMYGFLLVFGASGLVNRALLAAGLVHAPLPMVYNLFAVVLAEVVLIMPYCVLVLVAALHGIDRDLVESARSMGACVAQVFWHVILPLSLPGVWVSALLSFIWGLGAFVAPYLIGTPELYTLAVEVDRQTNWRLNWAMGAAVATIMIAVIGALVAVYLRVQRRAEATA